jgi:adenylate cyclase
MLLSATDYGALRGLLGDLSEQPDRRDQIIGEIGQQFQRPLAILVIDSCRFARTVRSAGVVDFLARIERLKQLIVPIISATGGSVLRREADSIFAVFPTAAEAVSAATRIIRAVKVANVPLPAAEEFYVAAGIGYGELLMIDANEIAGDELDLASMLGETLAAQSEILLTAGAYAAFGNSPWEIEQTHFNVSGLDLTTYRIVQD